MSRFLKKYWHLIALAFIVLLGGFLRFYRLPRLTSFHHDTARDIDVVRRIVQDHKLTLLGPPTSFSISGNPYGVTYFGPIFYYLIAPFLFLSRLNPIGPALAVAALGIITIILTFIIVEKMTDNFLAALLAALLLACSPAAVKFSRWAWNPNLTPLFSLLVFYFLLIFMRSRKYLWVFITGFCFGIVFQLHFISYWLFLFTLWAIFYLQKGRLIFKLRSLFCFLLGILIPTLPMVIFEVRHHWLNIRSMVFNIINQSTKSSYLGFNLSRFKQILLSLGRHFLGINQDSFLIVFSLLLILFMGYFLLKRNLRERYLLVLGFFLFGFLGSSIFGGGEQISPHYFLPLSVAFFILLGVFIAEILKIKRVGLFLVLLFVFGSVALSIPKNWKRITQIRSDSLERYQDVSNLIITDILLSKFQNEVNVANLLDNDRRAISFRYFFNAQKIPILGVEDYPNADILYVIDKDYGWDGIVNNTDTWEVYSFQPKVLLDTIDGPKRIKIYKIGKKKNG